MSKLRAKAEECTNRPVAGDTVVNFMNGVNYVLSPLMKLKMIAASSIFGEPQYYNDGMDKKAYVTAVSKGYALFKENTGKRLSEIMTEAIDEALDYDFKATLDFALELRSFYFMRLNPQVIMVRAAMHKKRAEFNAQYPGYFRKINEKVMRRCDEPSSQLAYYIYANGSKARIPSMLKRSWADRYEKASRYELSKYKNAELGIIDTARICHASSDTIDELMKNGRIDVMISEKTWEQMRSSGMSWKQILTNEEVYIPHMALLRNLNNIFRELDESDSSAVKLADDVLDKLLQGVPGGKQFPFRYYTAHKYLEQALPFKEQVEKKLEECLMKSRENMPRLEGKTIVLTDNSGSAHGTFNSTYGSVRVSEINNLSAILTAQSCDEGYVGVFGDRLEIIHISKDISPFEYMKKIERIARTIGQSTECGIWLFFKEALEKEISYDNIFVYLDMQAGHGGLYVTSKEEKSLKNAGADYLGRYVNVLALVESYRKKVNSKANMFTVQTAGYCDSMLPEYCYRTAILSGWTGKEIIFAESMNKLWNEVEAAEN